MNMRFYNQPHRFYAGGDLHARSLYLHILDDQGQTRFQENLAAKPESFLHAIEPFRDGLVVGVECMFAWYWLADLCEDQHIPFVLGHALYMKAIHGGKAKDDKIDSKKIAQLLRGGNLPIAYAYIPRAGTKPATCCAAACTWSTNAPRSSLTWSTPTASTTCRPSARS
jgi:hypothetical protein